MKVSEVIRKAITHIEAGWCRFALDDDQGNVCGLGAVNTVVFGAPSWFRAEAPMTDDQRILAGKTTRALNQAVMDLELMYAPRGAHPGDRPHRATTIMDYNNHIAQDEHDVMNLMEKVAITYEERGE